MKISFSPKEFLRKRRPERFSDSKKDQRPILDRSLLEYHIDTLTSRNQDTEFERFSLELAKRTICPNLRPQTGPTGGGDSKVDTETFPVSEQLSLAWYIGEAREAASERWAFAFSAKKDWQPKVRSDVKKIAETARGYTKVFFISNQFIRDRARSQAEDALAKEFTLDVRILDRTWILDQVFSGGHESLAISELHIEISTRSETRKGPRDCEREAELAEIEQAITSLLQEDHKGVKIVDYALRAADLARAIERSRTEVDGMYVRAEQLAKRYGTHHQQLAAVYQRAWTAFWWNEDYATLNELYSVVELLAGSSDSAYDLELLHNLWFLLFSTEKLGIIGRNELQFDKRTVTLAESLNRISRETDKPSSALHARFMLLIQHLSVTLPDAPDSIMSDLCEVVSESQGLVGFPSKPLFRLILELGQFIGDRPAYDKLIDVIVDATAAHDGDIAAARIFLQRGMQKLDAEKYYEAIEFIGQALGRLSTNETRHELITALELCSYAYESVGLLWAARGSLLRAASLLAIEFHTYSDVSSLRSGCFCRLKWLELMLGRLPHILAWHEIDFGTRHAIDSENSIKLKEDDISFDLILGILLLRTDIDQLRRLSKLPDVLESVGLDVARTALLFSFGYSEDMVEKFQLGSAEVATEFCAKWRDQPAAKEIPTLPWLYDTPTVVLTSKLLGCEISVISENKSPCLELAESILAGLESMLATGLRHRIVACEPTITLDVTCVEAVEDLFEFEMQDKDGIPYCNIRSASFNPHRIPHDSQVAIQHKLWELSLHIFARAFWGYNLEQITEKLFDECAFERAFSFTGSFVSAGNVLGHNPKTRLEDWFFANQSEYVLRRDQEWDAEERGRTGGPGEILAQHSDNSVSPTKEWNGFGEIKQNQIKMVSLIRHSLWEEARWMGVAFFTWKDDAVPPVLALGFRGKEAAASIFSHLQNEVGKRDADNKLKLTILRGISCANPFAYRVMVGSDPIATQSKYAVTMNRCHTMEPQDDRNLSRFLRSFEKIGSYFFTYAIAEGSSTSDFASSACIVKHHLSVREAWSVALNDAECMGIQADDDPIVPAEIKNAPVVELLNFLKAAVRSE
ncbi:MAG: hypothetical protein ACFUZC_09950 [Chthoniobacteraceae bacterium]